MTLIHFRESQDFYSILNQSYSETQWGKQSPINVVLMKRNREYWAQNRDEWFSHNYLDSWVMISQEYTNSVDTNIRLLLQYDQFVRHPSSLSEDKQYEVHKPLHYRFATSLALNMIHNSQYSHLPAHERVFTLLTIRHNNNLKLKYFALHKIHQELEKSDKSDIPLWLRFLNASILDIDTWKTKNKYYSPEDTTETEHTYWLNAMPVIQKPEYTQHIIGEKKANKIRNTLLTKMEPLVLEHSKKSNKFAVSISGGMDSMVVSSILNILAKKHNLKMILLHICYNNRQAVHHEISLLKYWAKLLDCPLYIRRIDELTRSRDTQFRRVYEEVTRKIRFSFYQYFKCPIILGHNRDDTFENMFSNLARQIHFDNLSGMLENSVESNITLLRPFLTIDKSDILKYADTNQIPHLIDSTPPWSERGKTRDVLMPSIEKFNPNILPGLEEFAQFTSFLYKQWEQSCSAWIEIIPKTSINEGVHIQRDTFFNSNYPNLAFWVKLWFVLDLPYRPSNRSFHTAIDRLETYKNKTNYRIRCSLIKNIVMEICPKTVRIQME
jgi:tRNA(Ile)-lysidine synthetase-like protein